MAFPLSSGGRRLDSSSALTDAAGHSVGGHAFQQSSFATYAIATERNAIKVGADAPLDVLAPLGCGVPTGAGTVLVALDVQPGDTVAVFGTGSVALSAVMAAAAAQAELIIVLDKHGTRGDLACELGATGAVWGWLPRLTG